MKCKIGDEVLVRAKIAGCESSERCMLKVDRTELFVNAEDIIPIPDMTAEEAWEIAKKFNSLSSNALIEIFDTNDIPYILDNLTFWKIKEKIEGYELNKIKFGDVVIPLKGHYREGEPGILVCVEPSELIGVIHPGIEFTWYEKQSLKYTGHHIDIDKIFEQIGECE